MPLFHPALVFCGLDKLLSPLKLTHAPGDLRIPTHLGLVLPPISDLMQAIRFLSPRRQHVAGFGHFRFRSPVADDVSQMRVHRVRTCVRRSRVRGHGPFCPSSGLQSTVLSEDFLSCTDACIISVASARLRVAALHRHVGACSRCPSADAAPASSSVALAGPCGVSLRQSAAEPASRKGLGMAKVLCTVLRAFFVLQERLSISVPLDHVPGISHDLADALRRDANPSDLGFLPF